MIKLFSGDWEHLFEGERTPRATRVVINLDRQEIVALVVLRNRAVADSYTMATRAELEDIQDSMLNANDAYEAPEDHGFELVTNLPEWATSHLEDYVAVHWPMIEGAQRRTLIAHVSSGWVAHDIGSAGEVNISGLRGGVQVNEYIRGDGLNRPA